MAWAEKLASGWRGRYRDQHGVKRKVVQADGALFPRKRDAIEAADDEAAKGRRTAAVEAGTMAASIPWGEWWDTIEPRRDSGNSDTARTERLIVDRWVRPWWGDVPLNKITRRAIQRWVDDTSDGIGVRAGLSPGYARRIYAVFSVSMSTAVAEDVLSASPCAAVKLPKIPKRSQAHMRTDHADTLDLRDDYADAVAFGLETGLRPGELCGLHARRMDLERGWLEVVDTFVYRRRVIRPTPKDKDVRMVPLSSKAVEIARRRLAGRNLTGGCGLPHTDGTDCRSALVFLTERGRPMTPNAFSQCIKRAADKAGVDASNMYSVRRGYATRAAEGGMDAFLLADLMGHADIRVTRRYVQMSDTARARALAALGEATPLRPVGQPGADAWGSRGADLDRRPLEDTGPDHSENVG